MKQVVLLAAVVVMVATVSAKTLSLAESDLSAWESFKSEYKRKYESPEEELMRRSLFIENKRSVEEINAKHERENKTLLAVMNEQSDLSDAELEARLGLKAPDEAGENSYEAAKFLQSIYDDNSTKVPDEVDWRKVPGRVTPVKDQGLCGSCWAFAATGVLEGQETVRQVRSKIGEGFFGLKKIVALSEQSLVDCLYQSQKDGGCGGGNVAVALNFVKGQGGIVDEKSYPYKSLKYENSQCCHNKNNIVFSLNGVAFLPRGDEDKLKEVVARYGPVAVSMAAERSFMREWFISEEVYHCQNAFFNDGQLNHAVLVVGYGTDPKQGDYWIVKNSWGEKWGDKGYARMARNRENNCGIAADPVIPIF